MEALLYLGCTVPVRNLNYEVSARLTAKKLGITLRDHEDFGCCGFPLKSLDAEDTLLISARNLALAEKEGLEICGLCNACVGTLSEAAHKLDSHPDLKERVNKKLQKVNLHYEGPVRVRHYMRLLWEEIGLEAIEHAVVKPLTDVVLAAHYGCHYLKPSELTAGFDSPEVPRTLSALIAVTGAAVVDYPSLKDCCGGGVLGMSEEVANALARNKLQDVAATNAQALVLVCPFCNVMYEGQQKKIAKAAGLDLKVPVVYYPQILGLALGFSSQELGFKLNRVKPSELLKIVEG
ncbi:MAG TPA: CoB--CoM heterodisulfide reductase iron-sulfur subunit B family protein [Desulfomonilaceae bacterium]|nr:CoB--CoM heterodisulfide reductase iron-sulfur subunit B family protein [Desulfomonilaceae bacterium]